MKRAVVVVGKAPRAGQTKTRLTPPLTPDQAAALYRGFLQDTTATAIRLGWERVTLIHPADPHTAGALAAIVPHGVRLEPQDGSGLGSALAGAFRGHLAEGFDQVILIGSDNPTLPAGLLARASDGLKRRDVAIGPSSDGGYYLIGMSRPHVELFDRITWSTEVVFDQTLERAREAGLTVDVLPEWYDVDTAADLVRLGRELHGLPPSVAPATRAVLDRLNPALTV